VKLRAGSTTLPVAEGRSSFAALVAGLGEPVPEVLSEDRTLPDGTGIRVYRRPSSSPDGPAVAFFHGGGWVFGDLDSHDTLCRGLARASGATIVAVGYRRAPEHPFPAALEDCVAATAWLASSDLGGGRLVVAGDSAGGNLAAAVALCARDAGEPEIAAQVLLYPMLVPPGCGDPHPGDSPLLTRAESHWFWQRYLPDGVAGAYATPGLAADLAGLPPTHLVLAGIDPLREEGLAFADALRAAGVPVTVREHEDLHHGFLLCTRELPAARAAIDEVGKALWATGR